MFRWLEVRKQATKVGRKYSVGKLEEKKNRTKKTKNPNSHAFLEAILEEPVKEMSHHE